MSQLKADTDTIIAKMLGLERRWGREWEVDHCNGRMSHITQFIDETAKVGVTKWLEENLTEDLLKRTFNTQIQKVMYSDFKSSFEYKLRSAVDKEIEKFIQAEAQRIAKGIVDELREQCATGETPNREVDRQEG